MSMPFADACEQNKTFILEAIRPWLRGRVLEIGSGTGQHAVFFAAQAPDVTWQTTDLADNLAGIRAWIAHAGLANLPEPLELDVLGRWPRGEWDFAFSANTFHIMHADMVAACMRGIGDALAEGAAFAVYGPFNYDGAYTSDSNARFDAFLKSQDPASGIRDFTWLQQLAGEAGLVLADDIAMPANNRTIVWKKRTL